MAYISFQPSDFFKTLLYTGDAAVNSITGVGFTPNFVWFKGRSGSTSHQLYDTARGNDSALVSSTTAAAIDATADGFTSLDSDGYTFNGSGGGGNVNGSGTTYVAWNWKGGTTSIPSGGTITPTAANYSATAGFGIYLYTGTGSAGTIAHGLGATPTAMIIKRYNTGGNSWAVYNKGHAGIGTDSADYVQALNDAAAQSNDATYFNDTVPTSTVFSVGSANGTNGSVAPNGYVAYVFTNKRGFSHCGAYRGNSSSTDGPFVYTGFRPAFIMLKANAQTTNWMMFDDKREGYNVDNDPLYADVDVAEGTADNLDIVSNGFKIRAGSGGGSVNEINTDGEYYSYIAFAEFPFVSSNSKAGTAR